MDIRALGNWTNKLNDKIKQRGGQQIYVRYDGPYGNLSLNYHRFTHVLLVVGGIGITPVVGILKHIFLRQEAGRSLIQKCVSYREFSLTF